jgi:hypothetical protein
MRWPIYTPSFSTETMAVLPPTTPRRVTWSRSRAAAVQRRRDGRVTRGCLPLCEKAVCALYYSTWRIWGESLPPPTQPCTGTGGGCGVERGWLQISLFCSEDCRLRCEMVKFRPRIGNQ